MDLTYLGGKPRIFISPETKLKLDYYIEECDKELSGLGTVTKLENNQFFIKDILLLDQRVTSGTTELDQDAVANFLVEMIQEGKNPEDVKLWWHSHVRMNVYWSPTDKATMRSFNNGFMIGIVGNKNGEYLCRLDIFEPIELYFDKIELEISYRFEENKELKRRVKAEIKQKVRVLGNSWNRYQYGSGYTKPEANDTGKVLSTPRKAKMSAPDLNPNSVESQSGPANSEYDQAQTQYYMNSNTVYNSGTSKESSSKIATVSAQDQPKVKKGKSVGSVSQSKNDFDDKSDGWIEEKNKKTKKQIPEEQGLHVETTKTDTSQIESVKHVSYMPTIIPMGDLPTQDSFLLQ